MQVGWYQILLWVELCPPCKDVQALAFRTLNVIFFGNRVFAEMIELKGGH